MKDHRHRRTRAGSRIETAFETTLGAGKDDFGHKHLLWMGAHGGCAGKRRPIYKSIFVSQSSRSARLGQRIYLDHAATTPLLAEAREAMALGLERWANPSSPHAEGRAARAGRG